MNQIVKFMFRVTALIVVFAFNPVPKLPAQIGQSPRNPPDPARHAEENELDLEQRIWNLRLLSEQARKPGPKRPTPQQALEQMQKDFVRLQILNKSLLRAALGDAPLDPTFVSKSVTEIRERAARLNTNLALPEAEKTNGPMTTDAVASPQQLKPPVLRLGRLIFSFVDNPFFKEASVVDTQLTTKARRDLEDIIELSQQIKKSSEQLGKTTRN
jgi:hypothetical protein